MRGDFGSDRKGATRNRLTGPNNSRAGASIIQGAAALDAPPRRGRMGSASPDRRPGGLLAPGGSVLGAPVPLALRPDPPPRAGRGRDPGGLPARLVGPAAPAVSRLVPRLAVPHRAQRPANPRPRGARPADGGAA